MAQVSEGLRGGPQLGVAKPGNVGGAIRLTGKHAQGIRAESLNELSGERRPYPRHMTARKKALDALGSRC